MQLFPLRAEDLVVDIGSNDGTLLGNFHRGGHRVCGVEPTNAHKLAVAAGIPTVNAFFGPESAGEVGRRIGRRERSSPPPTSSPTSKTSTKSSTACCRCWPTTACSSPSRTICCRWLRRSSTTRSTTSTCGITRSPASSTCWRCTAWKSSTPSGSRRTADRFACTPRARARGRSATRLRRCLRAEESALTLERLAEFRRKVSASKLDLLALLHQVRRDGSRVYAVGAPSRASTLVNYVGLDDSIVDCVLEIKGSYKIGKYMPGTLIPSSRRRSFSRISPNTRCCSRGTSATSWRRSCGSSGSAASSCAPSVAAHPVAFRSQSTTARY